MDTFDFRMPYEPQDGDEHFDPNSDGFGFVIRTVLASTVTASLNVYAISGGAVEYDVAPSSNLADLEVEPYVSCFIKWDSCSDWRFGFNENGAFSGSLHFCGVRSLLLHIALVKRLYEKAFEVMRREPQDGEELK